MIEEFEKTIQDRHQAAMQWKEANQKKVFGYLCCLTPETILHAADVLPVRIFGSPEKLQVADEHLVPYGCRYAASCLDLAARGVYDYLDGVVIPNSCDLISKLEYWWKELVPRKGPTLAGVELCPYVLYIAYPEKRTGRKVLDYYKHELREFKQALERGLRREITDEDLSRAIAVYNEHYQLMGQLKELRKRSPLPISGSEAWQIEYASQLMPKEQHNRLLKGQLDQLSQGTKAASGVRIFLSASATDVVNARLYQIIEKAGGQVVSEDISCHTSYYGNTIQTNGDPLTAIAQHSLEIDCPRSTETCSPATYPYPTSRWDRTRSRLEGYNAQGAIFYIINYCECRAIEYPYLRDKIREELDIPVLLLQGDYSLEGLEQVRGRIEAFVEMIGG
ncbi:MAG: 2-hydroxyacyl-CoA dehydratase [Nitrospinae bacterium]|nr:2-hydroxyacyl-CoA dehydratase [Nitrospinota bacterium]